MLQTQNVAPIRNIVSIAWERWKIIGTQVGDFNARVLMSLFYFTVVLVFGVINTVINDPLHIKHLDFAGVRRERKPVGETLETSRRQF